MRASDNFFSGPKKVLLISAAIVGVFVVLIGMKIHSTRVAREIAALRTEVSQYVAPTTITAARLGEIRAERYSIEARFDPLIALAGSDTDGMRKALIPLQGEAAEILGSYAREDRAKIEPVLYPDSFLSELPDLEDMRRTVTTAPRPDAVRRYDAQLKRTIQAYRNDIALYKQTLVELSASDKSTTIHYLAGSTTVSEIIEKLETLDQHALTLEAAREKRYLCFKGKHEACTALATSFSALVKAPAPITPSQPPTPLSKSLIYKDIVHRAFSEMLGIQETYSSVIKLSRSECLSGTVPAYYYFFQSREEEGILSSTATPLNDLFFYDLTESVHSQKNPPAYLQELYDNGLRYNFQNIGNLYFCPNSGNVLSDAATLVSLHDRIKEAPLFADHRDAYPELARLEKTFTDAPIPNDEDMDAYFSAITETLRNQGEQVFATKIGTTTLFEIEEMITEWRNRSSHFEQSLTAAHHINRLSKGIIRQSKQPVYSFLVSRVYASIFFMTFNHSLSGESFLFLDSINTEPQLSNFHLLPLSNGVRGLYDTEQVFEELHREQTIIDAVLQVER